MSNIHKLALDAAMGMDAYLADSWMQDMYEFSAMLSDGFHSHGTSCKRIRKSDDRAFAKKVEKRRKKNKNKKTHRK